MATQRVPKRTNAFQTTSMLEQHLEDALNLFDKQGKKIIAIIHKGVEEYQHQYLVVTLKSDLTFEEIEVADELATQPDLEEVLTV